MPFIDLNADMGEYSNAGQAQDEAALMALVSSCSIACGGHAGNADTMKATIGIARRHDVAVGAHPSYPDRENFGRRSMTMGHHELAHSLHHQIGQLHTILTDEDVDLAHVKAHGALYNDAAKDDALARIVVKAAKGAAIFGPPGSALERAAQENGNWFFAEGFVDRLYQSDGSLTSRTHKDAVIADIKIRARQAIKLATNQAFDTNDGTITLRVDTLCIHSDSAGAIETTRAVRAGLLSHGVRIAAPGRAAA